MDMPVEEAQAQESAVLSTAALPYVPVYPAPNHLAWSDDFQACAVTRHEIHLLSPEIGYCFDQKNAHLSGTLSGKFGERADEKEDPAQLKWFQTSIPTESEILWEYYTNDIKDTLIGGSASMWKMARWSPRGTSSIGTCLLAALSTDGEVFVYGPPNIPHRGKWSKAYNLTLTLHNWVMPAFEQKKQNTQEYRRDISNKLSEVQALSIAWSSAPPFRTDPHFASRALLAVGHRSGHITLWTASQTSGIHLLGRIRPTKAWITSLEFSQWQEHNGSEASVSLAVATSDGEAIVLRIMQASTQPLADTSIEPASILSKSEYQGSLKIESSYSSGSQPSPVSAFIWLNPSKLSLTRLGALAIVSLENLDQVTIHQLELQPVGNWQGVNSWAPVSGLVYSSASDVLVASLHDGSMHAVASASTSAPSLEYGQRSKSQDLTDSVRQLIASNEASIGPSRMSKALATKILSLTTLPSGELCWLYELERPDLLMYLQDSRHTSKLVISDLQVGPSIGSSGKLRVDFADPPAALYRDPTAATFTDLIETRRDPATGVSKLYGLDTILYPEGSDWAKDFLSSMLHLFHSEQAVKEAQLKAFVALQLSIVAPSPEATRSRMLSKKNLAHMLLNRIAYALHKFKGPEEDVQLLESVASAIERSHTDEGGLSFEGITKVHECAACHSPISMENLKVAICSQGHRWHRCALTLRPIFRLSWTCVGCGSKYSNQDGQEASLGQGQDTGSREMQQPRLEDVAKVARVCMWCGRHTMSYMGSSR